MSFPLIGNERIKDSVCAAVGENRIPHAILIEGEKGTGRHTLARYIAQSAVCAEKNPPCGKCRSCTLFKAGTHPDVVSVSPEDGKKNIAVSQIRELRSNAYIKPQIASCRVFVIDMADTMNEQSQNALLKVLEEPPGAAVFILVAESKAALLDTVLSRCTVLSLSLPESGAAADYLTETAGCDRKTAVSALNECGGNIGRAMEVLSGKSKKQSAAAEFLRAALGGNGFECLCITNRLEKNRPAAEAFFKDLKLEIASEIKKSRIVFTKKRLLRYYDGVSELEKSLVTNINLSLIFSALTCLFGS